MLPESLKHNIIQTHKKTPNPLYFKDF